MLRIALSLSAVARRAVLAADAREQAVEMHAQDAGGRRADPGQLGQAVEVERGMRLGERQRQRHHQVDDAEALQRPGHRSASLSLSA